MAESRKDIYFEAGIAQSLVNRGNLWKKLTNWNLPGSGRAACM